MASFTKLNAFVQDKGRGLHNLNADQLIIVLTNAAVSASHAVLSDLTQISYTYASSRVIAGTSYSQSGGLAKLLGTDLVLTASGGAVGPFRSAYICNNTATGKNLIGAWDNGTSITLNDGDSETFDFDGTNGLCQEQ